MRSPPAQDWTARPRSIARADGRRPPTPKFLVTYGRCCVAPSTSWSAGISADIREARCPVLSGGEVVSLPPCRDHGSDEVEIVGLI